MPRSKKSSERARQFIDDVVKINKEFGMHTVHTAGAYDSAVARATRSAESVSRLSEVVQRSH